MPDPTDMLLGRVKCERPLESFPSSLRQLLGRRAPRLPAEVLLVLVQALGSPDCLV